VVTVLTLKISAVKDSKEFCERKLVEEDLEVSATN
jgi:hypothetical protein